jgi:hypothetical protein
MGQWHDYLKKTDKDGPWFLTGKLAEHVMGVSTSGRFRARWWQGRGFDEACNDPPRHHQKKFPTRCKRNINVHAMASNRSSCRLALGLQRGEEGREWERWVCYPWLAGLGSTRGGRVPTRLLSTPMHSLFKFGSRIDIEHTGHFVSALLWHPGPTVRNTRYAFTHDPMISVTWAHNRTDKQSYNIHYIVPK